MVIVGADAKSLVVRDWIIEYLHQAHIECIYLGATGSNDQSDITHFLPNIATRVVDNDVEALMVCGNGVGVSIGLNRYKGVRAVLAANPKYATWGKTYDNCNVLCLAAWDIGDQHILGEILDAWFATKFEALPRRINRLKLFDIL